jgi:hypothetical protein
MKGREFVWPKLCVIRIALSRIIFTPCEKSDEIYTQLAYEFRGGSVRVVAA